MTARRGVPGRRAAPRAVPRPAPARDRRRARRPAAAGAVQHRQRLGLPPGPRAAPGRAARRRLAQRLGGEQRRQRFELRAGSPRRSAASADSSTAVARSSSSRAAAAAANGSRRTSASAGPRQQRRSPRRAARGPSPGRGRGPRRPALEPERVDVVRVDGQPVAARNGLDHVGAERPAQPRHERLQRVGDGVRRFCAPQPVHQRIPRHCAAGVEREAGERAAQAHAAGRRCAVRPGGHRAEHSDPHGVSVPVSAARSPRHRARVRPATAPPPARRGRTCPGPGSRRCRASGSPDRRRR